MAYAAPTKDHLFTGSDAQKREKFAAMQQALNTTMEASLVSKMQGQTEFTKFAGITKSAGGRQADAQSEIMSTLEKSLTGDQLAAVSSALAGTDIAKANGWTLSNPLNVVPFGNQGLVPYNLSPILQMIVPREMPLRNSTPRTRGEGTATNFRTITGVSNSASGGVANLQTTFSSANTTQSVGGINWNRPPGITYAATSATLSYVESGVSDYVTMQAEYASQGYTSLRSLSAMATLWASMLGDERNMLGSVAAAGTIAGWSATCAVDTTQTATGLPGAAATAVYATYTTAASIAGVLGESKAITLTGTPTTTANQGIKITVEAGLPAGALALNIYANYSGTYYKGTTVVTNVGASPAIFTVVAALPSTVADNGSFLNPGYDGFISVLTNASLTGYNKAINGALSTGTPTTEFQTAFTSLYSSIGARPEKVYTTPSIREAIAQSLAASGGSSTGFRMVYNAEDGQIAGNYVDGIRNMTTGDVVDLVTHRYMPAGTAMIISENVPWADSGITSCWEVNGVVDTVILEWPQMDLNYAMSSYSYNVLAYKAPALSGILTGITN